MTLWQGDWKQVTIDGQVQWLITFLDEASPFITSWGLFPNATTEARSWSSRPGSHDTVSRTRILTDHSSYFVSNHSSSLIL